MEFWEIVILALIVAIIVAAFHLLSRQRSTGLSRELELFRENISQALESNRELVNQRLNDVIQSSNSALQSLREQVNELREHVRRGLEGTQKIIGERLDAASFTIQKVSKELGELREATANVHNLAKDIASLQEILRPPKLRGGLGEQLLAELLRQILPPENYTLQHTFKDGETVDAVIRLGEGLIPVDSKFPLENFRRYIEAKEDNERAALRREFENDLKKHIDAIASKYIKPDEGTYDFALMYIPAENIYYETIIRDERFGDEKGIDSYALERRVIPVSPNSFYAYLRAIAIGLKGMKIEESARRVLADIERLQKEHERFAEDYRKLGVHLRNALSSYDSGGRRIERFTSKLEGLTELRTGGELPPPTE